MCCQTLMTVAGFCAPHQKPVAIHLVKRSPQHHDSGGLEFLQTCGEVVELAHPALVDRGAVNQHVGQIQSLFPEPAAAGLGRVVEVHAGAHQPAGAPVSRS